MPNEFVARNGIIALNSSSITGSLGVSGGITGSLLGTASFSSTASFVNPLNQTVQITGSLQVTGSTSRFINLAPNDTVAEFIAGGSTKTRFSYLTANSSAAIYFDHQNGSLVGQNYSYFTISGASSKLKLSTDNSANPIEMQGGNVLINTTTDAGYKLDVNGTARVTGNTFLGTSAGSVGINKTTANATLDVSGSTIISGSFTVATGSGVELQVTNTGVKIGNAFTDTHPTTGSLNISGSINLTGNQTITGSFNTSGSANIKSSGSAVFSVDGTSGRLFQVDDSLSGSLFSVNTAAGLPVIEAFSDNTVRIGQYGQRALYVSQSRVGVGKETGLNANLDVSGSAIITGSLLISTGSLSDFLRTTNAGITNFRISSSGYPVWGVPGYDVISTPGATWTPTVGWDGTNVTWGDARANRQITTTGINTGYVTVPNISLSGYSTQVNNLFGSSFTINNNNLTSTLGTVNMIIQATGSQTGNMLQFRNGAGSVLSAFTAGGSLLINTSTDAGYKLDVYGNSRIYNGTLTVATASNSGYTQTYVDLTVGGGIKFAHTNGTIVGRIEGDSGGAINGLDFYGYDNFRFKTLNTTINFIPSTATTWYTYNTNFNFVGYTGFGGEVIMKNNADGTEVFHAYLADTYKVTFPTGNISIGKPAATTPNAKLDISGSAIITGSLTVTSGITGSLFGTASWATNATRVIGGTKDYVAVWDTGGVLTTGSIFNPSATGNVGINNLSPVYKLDISGSTSINGGGLIVSGTLATSGSTSQGLIAPLKFTTVTLGSNYTLVYTDEGKMVEMNNNADAPLTVTIPLNSSVPFPIGTEISIIQIGSGTTVITGSAGVTVNSSLGLKTLSNTYDVASIVKRGTNSWYLFGNLS